MKIQKKGLIKKWSVIRMNFFVKNFFILFFIILVISITPGFAVKVGDNFNYNDTEKILSDLDKKTND